MVLSPSYPLSVVNKPFLWKLIYFWPKISLHPDIICFNFASSNILNQISNFRIYLAKYAIPPHVWIPEYKIVRVRF